MAIARMSPLQIVLERVLLPFNDYPLNSCEFVHGESCGPAAGLGCTEKGTVLHLADEREYCGKHFRGVSRG